MKKQNILKAQQVETLAAQLLNPTLTSSARDVLVNRLTQAFMAYKGWTGFDGAHFCEGETLEQSFGYGAYSGRVLFEAIDFAVRTYGKVSRNTGKVIPFCQLVNSALKLKAPDVVKEKLDDREAEDQRAKEAAVKAFLRRLCKEKGYPAPALKFNVLNKEAVTRFLETIGASEQDLALAMYLIESKLVVSDNFNMDDEDDNNVVNVSNLQAYRDFQASEVHLDGAFDTIHRTLVKAGPSKEGKALKQLLTYHCVDQGAEGNLNVVMFLKDDLDPDFQKFLRSYAGVPKDDRAIVAFTGKKLDTVQKNLCSARALLKKQAAAEKRKANSICC